MSAQEMKKKLRRSTLACHNMDAVERSFCKERMIFMVIERFKGSAAEIGERFRRRGRMLPLNVSYHASWIDQNGTICFQLMEAPDLDALKEWTMKWDDLAAFEIIPVLPSADFWANYQSVASP
jgi:hypothetical protein